jgi:uncharacterized membrane protein
MKDVPVDAQVVCADGPCGESITVIVERGTRKVTHFVVKDETLPRPPYQRMVPVDQVVETSHDLIRLRCTKEKVGHMEPFIRTRYIPKQQPDYSLYQAGEGPSTSTSSVGVQTTKVEEEMMPEGELGVSWGTRVEATDGHIGHVAELLSAEDSDEIDHLVLQEGHLWGKKEIVLPAFVVDRVEGDTVYLKLSKTEVERLPAIPVKRHSKKDLYGRMSVELVARVFDNLEGASEALNYVEGLTRRKVIKILNAAVLVKAEDATVSMHDKRDVEPKKGRLFGAITGGLIGLVGGPVGVVVGALAGAGTGGLAAKWIDMGFSDKFLAGLEEHMKPGSSALIVLVEHDWVHPMSESLADLGGVVFQQTLTDELAEELVRASEAEE